MSIRIMSLCWSTRLPTAAHKLVLLKLADHANDAGYCYPGVAGIAKACNLHDRSVRRLLADLRNWGFIQVAEAENPATQKPITYRVTPDTGVTPDVDVTPDTHVIPPLTPASIPPDTGVKETIIEPSSNHQYTRAEKITSKEPDGFDDFWKAYPKRNGKGAARKAYMAALKKAEPKKIIEAAKQFAQMPSTKKDNYKFCPYPATWLNQERWDDEPITVKRPLVT